MHLGIAAAGLALLAGPKTPIKQIPEFAQKIPGAKTFGNPAAVGLACLAADKFVKRNKWLRYAGYVGVALAALKLGEQGSDFKWVGDDDVGDLEDLEDLEDVDDLEDVEDLEGDDD